MSSTTPGRARPGRGVTLAAVVAALGGLLFGYDTGIISSAVLYFPAEFGATADSAGQQVWEVDLFGLVRLDADAAIQVVIACLLLGALAGAVAGGAIADAIGRKKTLVAVASVFVVGALGSASAPDVEQLIVARVVLGSAIGVSSVVVPTYIAEIAPTESRGRLVSMNQLMITVGIFVSYLVGFALSPTESWRWMVALGAVPALVMLGGLLRVTESPRWLTVRGRPQEARTALMRTRTAEEAEAEIYQFSENAKVERSRRWSDLARPGLRPAVILGVSMAFLNQMVGVNAVIYYAPTILTEVYGDTVALAITLLVGSVNVVITFVALHHIDRWGRRPLILGGTLGVAVSLIGLAVLFLGVPETGDPPQMVGIGLVVVLCLYIAAFAASLGLGLWLINSEVYPTPIRGKAASLGSSTHWALDLLISVNVLTVVGLVGPSGLFAIFAVIAAGGLAFLWRTLPETAGKSLEQINDELRERTSARG